MLSDSHHDVLVTQGVAALGSRVCTREPLTVCGRCHDDPTRSLLEWPSVPLQVCVLPWSAEMNWALGLPIPYLLLVDTALSSLVSFVSKAVNFPIW